MTELFFMETAAPRTDEERKEAARLLLAFASLKRVGPKTLRSCLDKCANTTAVLEGDPDAVSSIGLPAAAKKAWLDEESRDSALTVADEELKLADEMGIRILLAADEEFPEGLKRIPDPPALLYVRGALPSTKAVAAVGTRNPTRDGRYMIRRFCAELAVRGWTIVSGLARGLDSVAHETALEFGAPTIAVLGHGLADEVLYPPENAGLAVRILEAGGALVSEYSIRSSAQRSNFVNRNRLQSGLSVATIVGEAGIKSGTMHTARAASKQERLVYAYNPPRSKGEVEQFLGLWKLIDEGIAHPLGSSAQMPEVLEQLAERFRRLYGTPLPQADEAELQAVEDKIASVENAVLRTENRLLRESLDRAEAELERERTRAEQAAVVLNDVSARAAAAAKEAGGGHR